MAHQVRGLGLDRGSPILQAADFLVHCAGTIGLITGHMAAHPTRLVCVLLSVALKTTWLVFTARYPVYVGLCPIMYWDPAEYSAV